VPLDVNLVTHINLLVAKSTADQPTIISVSSLPNMTVFIEDGPSSFINFQLVDKGGTPAALNLKILPLFDVDCIAMYAKSLESIIAPSDFTKPPPLLSTKERYILPSVADNIIMAKGVLSKTAIIFVKNELNEIATTAS